MTRLLCALVAVAGCAARPGVCTLNSDCPHGYYCEGTQCKRDCIVSNIDCPSGFVCNAVGKCETANGDGGVADDLAAADLSSGSDASVALKLELDLCASDGECTPPLVCRGLQKGGAARCTRLCTSTANCASGERCLTDASNTKTCLGEDVGRACTAAANCNYACLTNQQYCTAPCSGGVDCPNGWGCMMVASQNVCVRLEAACDATSAAACIAPAACDTSAVLRVGGCTSVCTTAADCPQRAAGFAPWTCDGGGICRRPPDVYGPLGQGVNPAQYACNAANAVVNLCNDAQHIDFIQFTVPAAPSVNCASTTTTPGAAGDACVDSCRYQGGCVYGYACTALGSIGSSRIGLCLPSLGTGEVGAHCTADGDCAFGFCNRTTNQCSRDCTFDGLCPSGSTCTAAGGPAVEGFAFKRCQ